MISIRHRVPFSDRCAVDTDKFLEFMSEAMQVPIGSGDFALQATF